MARSMRPSGVRRTGLGVWLLVAGCHSPSSQVSTTPTPNPTPETERVEAVGIVEAPSRPIEPEIDLGPHCIEAIRPIPNPAAQAEMNRASAALEQRDAITFQAALTAAAAHDLPQAHYNLGVLAAEHQRFVEAVERFEHTLELDPCYHAARIELARMHAEGWGVVSNPQVAVAMFRRVVEEAPASDRDGALAETNLALMHLYGLGVERSYSLARQMAARAASVAPEAAALLAALPEHDVWRATTLDAPRPIPYQAMLGARRPAWTSTFAVRAGQAIHHHPGPVVQPARYARRGTIAVGVPGDDRTATPGVETFHDCLEVSGSWEGSSVRVLSFHTNRSTCVWEGRVVRAEGEDVVAVGRAVRTRDPHLGEDTTSCQLRIHVDEDRVSLVDDWPNGCSRTACGYRGGFVGREMVATNESCDAIAEREATRLIAGELANEPEWAKEAVVNQPQIAARWADTRVVELPDEDPIRVTNRFEVCEDGTFRLDNWNGRGCDLRGRVTSNRTGELLLVASEISELWVAEAHTFVRGPACRLRTSRTRRRLEIIDVWPPGCHSMTCDAFATPVGASFRRVRGRRCDTVFVHPPQTH